MYLDSDAEVIYGALKERFQSEWSFMTGNYLYLNDDSSTEIVKAINMVLQLTAMVIAENNKLLQEMMAERIISSTAQTTQLQTEPVEMVSFDTEPTPLQPMEIPSTLIFKDTSCHFCDSVHVNTVYSEYHGKGFVVCKTHEYLVK